MLTFMDWCAHSDRLCEDLRRLIFEMAHDRACCRRCSRPLETDGRMRVAFTPGVALCFRCYHLARWPTTLA